MTIPLESLAAFGEIGATAVSAARVSRQPVSLLLVEVDHFALIDRTHGPQHAEGVLEGVARLAEAVLRPRDRMARRQADQLALLLPGASAAAASELARRLAAVIRGHPFQAGATTRTMPVSVSVGVASAPLHAEAFPALVAAAERALGRARQLPESAVAVALEPAQEPAHPPLDVDRFVGRADQLRMLTRALDDAVQGRAQLAVVHGEAGVGCSTIVAQLAPEVGVRGGAFVRGRARPLAVRPPYGTWAEVLEAIHRLSGAPTGEWRELPHLVPALASGGAASEATGGSQFRLLEELMAYVRDAAAARPLVIALDDMQWADEATWDALEHLVPRLAELPVLVVVVLRDDPADPVTLERRQKLTRLPGAHDVTLSRLTRDEVKRWVEGAFQHQEVGREFLSFIYRNAEGNPLFIGQLLRALVEEGAVRHTGERWEWRPVSQLQVPPGLDALVLRRITRFGVRAQSALATAAVIGRAFDAALLADAIPGEGTDVTEVIREGLDAGLLRWLPAEGDGTGDRYAAAHDRIGAVLCGRLAPQRLRRKHERVAQAIRAAASGGPAHAIEIAIHFDAAGVTAGAYEAALQAADHAERLYAHATTSELLRLAARNAGTPGELAAVRTRLATLAELAGHYDEAEELCDLAIEWYASQGDAARSIALRGVRERLRNQLGQPARRTLDTLLALDREAAEHGLIAERIALLTLVSSTYGRLGDRANSERIAAECVEMAQRVGDPALLADSLNRYAITMELRDPEGAKAIYGRSLALYEARADYRGQARIHNNIGVVAQLQGRLDEAARELATAIALARTAGMPDFWGAAALNLGVMMMKAGSFDRARELLSEALSLFATVKNSELQLYALYNLAHLERERGAHQSAAELYEVAVSLAQRIGQVDVEAGAFGGGGLSMLELARVEDAATMLRTSATRLADREDWFLGRELVELLGIRIALLEGRPADAVAQFERAGAIAEGSDLYSAAWLTAECAPLLVAHAPQLVTTRVAQYADRVGVLGFPDMTARFEQLAAQLARDTPGAGGVLPGLIA